MAVKVQYPGVDDAIRPTSTRRPVFGAHGHGCSRASSPARWSRSSGPGSSRSSTTRNEARNQQLFADFYRATRSSTCPTWSPLCRPARVLTTELAEGVRFDELLTWDQDERDLAAEAIYRFVFRSLYRLRAFNGDPHPGNYLFRPGGQVTFLDFGLVKHFTPRRDRPVRRHDPGHGDRAATRPATGGSVERIGLLRPGTPVSARGGHEYFSTSTSSSCTTRRSRSRRSGPPTCGATSTRRPYGPIIKAANLPASFVIIQRINLGLMAILGDLHATANFRRIAEELWPWVDGPPSTPHGRGRGRWLAARADGGNGGRSSTERTLSDGRVSHASRDGAPDPSVPAGNGPCSRDRAPPRSARRWPDVGRRSLSQFRCQLRSGVFGSTGSGDVRGASRWIGGRCEVLRTEWKIRATVTTCGLGLPGVAPPGRQALIRAWHLRSDRMFVNSADLRLRERQGDRRQAAIGPVFDALYKDSVDLAHLRMVCDWIQCRADFMTWSTSGRTCRPATRASKARPSSPRSGQRRSPWTFAVPRSRSGPR